MQRLVGKVAVVTGGGSGIGLATVEKFLVEGACVVVADYSGMENTAAERLGGKAVAFHVDVGSLSEMKELFTFTEQRFGRLDIVFNNAGIDGEFVPIMDNADENFTKLLEVNTRGALLGIKYGSAIMLKTGGGSIINTASTAAIRAVPNLAAYGASKAAILGLTRAAAVELAPQGIRVNTICPGPIDTPLLRGLVGEEGLTRMRSIVPMARLGLPKEVAAVACFLASDEASFVTGVSIPVDGGQVA